MIKRYAVGIIYFIVILMTLTLRVTGSVGIYSYVNINADYYFTLIVQLLCFGVLPLSLYCIFCKRGTNRGIASLSRDFNIKKVGFCDFALSVGIGVCMIYVATVVSFVWNVILNAAGFTSVSEQTEYASLGVLFLELLMTAVLPAVFEEITHRGLIFAGYRETGWKVVVISALLFALMHQNVRQTGYTFFDGLVLALLVYYTGSILPAMFVHFMNNAVSVLWDYGSYTGGWLSFMDKLSDWFYGSLIGYIVGVIIFVIASVAMFFMFKKLRDRAVSGNRIPAQPFAKPDADVLPLRRDGLLWAVIAVGVAATVFSLVWGILR